MATWRCRTFSVEVIQKPGSSVEKTSIYKIQSAVEQEKVSVDHKWAGAGKL